MDSIKNCKMMVKNTIDSIGDDILFKLSLENNWTKRNLYDEIIEILNANNLSNNFIESKENSTNNNSIITNLDMLEKNYDRFYLKFYGYYDKNLLPSDINKCSYCIHNNRFKNYHRFNQLKDDTTQVLCLVSGYPDFRVYDIFASYYVDSIENSNDNYNILYCGDKKTISRYFESVFGFRKNDFSLEYN